MSVNLVFYMFSTSFRAIDRIELRLGERILGLVTY